MFTVLGVQVVLAMKGKPFHWSVWMSISCYVILSVFCNLKYLRWLLTVLLQIPRLKQNLFKMGDKIVVVVNPEQAVIPELEKIIEALARKMFGERKILKLAVFMATETLAPQVSRERKVLKSAGGNQ
jgi:hypothetical protein